MKIDPERWERLQQLFHAAADLPVTEREAFIEAATDDPELRADVQALVAEDERASSPLDRSLPALAADVMEPALPDGRTIGPYRLRRVIGEGGMGIVYLAEREDLGNLVAIKMLRDAWVSPSRRERFANEQRTLAQLSHPSIAQVFDADTLADGTPYFAMEYVEGTNLTDYCIAKRSTLPERLRLFRSVCDAVQFAHQRAVIHRDLKPSNILVTSQGVVKLLDFGIAKHLEGAEALNQTRTDQRFLTPAYAAPEQIRGEQVGVYTDVYALGVLLFELLCGRHPYRRADSTAGQLERAILGDDPVRPSLAARSQPALGRSMPDLGGITRSSWEDLDVLCLTAMQKEPGRRYASVEALARDVDHFVRREPLDARPDSVRYRAVKFLRRNQRAVAVAAAVGSVLVGLTAFYTISVAAERNRAQAEAARAQQISDYLIGMFETGDPYATDQELDIPTLLARGEQRAEELASEPDVHAQMLDVLGRVETSISDYERAEALLQRALAIRRELDDGSLDVAETLTNLGTLLYHTGDYEGAEEAFREAVAIRERELPRLNADRATALDNLGVALSSQGNYDAAEPFYRDALEIRRELFAMPHADLGYSLNNLAVNLYDQGNYDEALTLYRQALELERGIYGDDHPSIATTLANLGRLHQDRREFADAEPLLTDALRIRRAALGDDHYETALSLNQLGGLFNAMGELNRARPYLEEALSTRERLLGPDHPSVATTLNAVGLVQQKLGDLAAAETAFRRALGIYRSTLGTDHRYTGVALGNLASVQEDRGDLEGAEATHREGVAILEAFHPPDHPELAVNRGSLGLLLLRQGKTAEAEPLLRSSHDVLLAAYGAEDDRTGRLAEGLKELENGAIR